MECLAACQRSDYCEHWTLDVGNWKCDLKQSNTETVQSESAISGHKLCSGYCIEEDFKCDTVGCDPEVIITVAESCSDEFTIEVLEGDFGDHFLEKIAVWINGFMQGYCDPGSSYSGNSPQWYSCGNYSIPDTDTLTVRLSTWDFVSPQATYNGAIYTIYGRITSTPTFYDYYAAAVICPNATQI